MQNRPFDAVIFDLDGTLLATEEITIEAGHTALTRMGLTPPQGFLHTLVGLDEPTSRRLLQDAVKTTLDHPTLEQFWAEEITRIRETRGIPLRPYTADIIAAVRDLGLPFAIATSSTREQAEDKLRAADLRSQFDIVVTRSDVRDPKPAPDIYLLVAARLGVAPARCVAFEDSDVGALAARAAGMTVVQIPDMVALSGDHADFLADDLMSGARGIGLIAA